MPDVTIIGAGPAGSVAAILLARRGWDVSLIEQHRFPRDKVCGECVSALGLEVLARLGLSAAIGARAPVVLRRSALVAASGEQTMFHLPHPMWGLSRRALDDALLSEARRAGASVLQPARVERCRDGVVTVRDLLTNRSGELRPGHVILADGKAAFAAERPPLTGDFGVKAHFTHVDDRADTITLFGVNGHYVGLAPIEAGRWNVAMSVPAARLSRFKGHLDALFQRLMRENAGLARRFRAAMRSSDWLVGPLPRFAVRRSWPAHVIPIGNAAAALEPIGGEGIGLAMRSAELAATAMIEQRAVESMPREFDRLWRVRRSACRLIAQLLSRPAIADDIVALAGANEHLGRVVMSCMGKR